MYQRALVVYFYPGHLDPTVIFGPIVTLSRCNPNPPGRPHPGEGSARALVELGSPKSLPGFARLQIAGFNYGR